MRKYFAADKKSALVYILTGLTFSFKMYTKPVFGGWFNTDINFRIFTLHFLLCQFRTFAVLHFAFYTSPLAYDRLILSNS